MMTYKLHFVSLTACIVLQTYMFSMADKSGVGRHRRTMDWLGESSEISKKLTTTTASNSTAKTSNPTTTTNNVIPKQSANEEKVKYSRMTGYEEKDIKPAKILDFIDNNLKKIVIGVIALVVVIIITLVCCCVCCAATVCNRTTKQLRDTKQEMHTAEKQEYVRHYLHSHITDETSGGIHVNSHAAVRSPYETLSYDS